MLMRSLYSLLIVILMSTLVACSSPAPPTEFAPDGEIVAKAIALQLNQTQQRLSQQLKATVPDVEISQIQVKLLEPVLVEELPTYHLQGTYYLKLILPRQQVNQPKNPFDIYLQRQAEGKTWRLLRRDALPGSQQVQWRSYLVE